MRLAVAILMLVATITEAAQPSLWYAARRERMPVASTGYTPPGYAQSLIWWKMDATSGTNIADYSAVGTNTAYATATAGGAGYYFTNGAFYSYMNGVSTNQHAVSRSTGTAIGHGKTNYTISVWVFAPYYQYPYSGIFSTRNGDSHVNGFMMGNSASSIRAWERGQSASYYTTTLLTNQWMNLTFAHSSNSVALYRNGILVQSGAGFGTQMEPVSGGNRFVGWDTYNTSWRFVGLIDDCYLTEYVFTATDATNHFLQGRSLP